MAFKTSLDLLPPDEETPGSTADPSDESSTEGRKLEFQDELIIQFNNSTTQVVKSSVSSCIVLTTVHPFHQMEQDPIIVFNPHAIQKNK